MTFATAKKFTKMSISHEKRIRQMLIGESITFDDEDAVGLTMPHNDALVITLLIFDTNVRRLLIY